MLKHMFFCRIWRYISCIVRRGETRYLPQYLQDLRHTCTQQLDVNLERKTLPFVNCDLIDRVVTTPSKEELFSKELLSTYSGAANVQIT